MRLTDTFAVGNSIVEIALADITTAKVDVIVNSVCDRLHFGSGVSGAILYKGGLGILDDLSRSASEAPLAPGCVVVSSAGELPYRYVFHAISSSCLSGSTEAILRRCVESCLDEARGRQIQSIAFPALGTGEMGFDIRAAATVLIKAVIDDCITKGGIGKIVFCLLCPDDFTSFFREAVKSSVKRETEQSDTVPTPEPKYPPDATGSALIEELRGCPTGQRSWRQYEDVSIALFKHLFTPPLSDPRTQKRTENNLRIRDAIFPNYAENGFWSVMDRRYGASAVLLECKNYDSPVGQEAVNQASRYLRSGTLGKIGFIASRKEPSAEAIKARAEVFRDCNCIITFLDDFDFSQMVDIKRLGALPETYLQRKIEDFLLAY